MLRERLAGARVAASGAPAVDGSLRSSSCSDSTLSSNRLRPPALGAMEQFVGARGAIACRRSRTQGRIFSRCDLSQSERPPRRRGVVLQRLSQHGPAPEGAGGDARGARPLRRRRHPQHQRHQSLSRVFEGRTPCGFCCCVRIIAPAAPRSPATGRRHLRRLLHRRR